MLSYRGYGLSTGVPNEKGIRIDAQTALDWLLNDARTKATRIVAYGQSIGGAVAVDLASRNGKSVSGARRESGESVCSKWRGKIARGKGNAGHARAGPS
jgi:fermentation-respiration switch protein FrsA (DUF1100 family)